MYSTKSKGCSTKNSRYVRENIETISQEYLNNTSLKELSKKYNVAPSTIKKAFMSEKHIVINIMIVASHHWTTPSTTKIVKTNSAP